ncbi:phosphate signaling complex PhoU family protein [Thermofilum pendens]|uniref:phosphate signaling complex PhoU family protein n=1 Tax=Thermofilum pendens TaxID=2269 RepID=UPI000699AC77|nr:phosphate uptake regulator PhoU [Thermofilum pendens]
MTFKRVIRISGGYYVALPKGWVEQLGLAGSYVKIEYLPDGSLLVRPAERGREEQLSVKVLCDEHVFRRILSAYLKGYEVIEVELSPGCLDKARAGVESAQRLLPGLELVEEGSERLVLQCFIKPDYNLDSIIYRMDSTTREMLLKATDLLLGGGDASAVSALDDRVDRLYFLAVRIMRRRIRDPTLSPDERLRLLDMRLTAKNLENLGDSYESLARLDARLPEEGLAEASRALADLQRRSVKLFLEGSESRDELLLDYRRLEEYLKSREGVWPRAVVEKLAFALVLVKDIIDLA